MTTNSRITQKEGPEVVSGKLITETLETAATRRIEILTSANGSLNVQCFSNDPSTEGRQTPSGFGEITSVITPTPHNYETKRQQVHRTQTWGRKQKGYIEKYQSAAKSVKIIRQRVP